MELPIVRVTPIALGCRLAAIVLCALCATVATAQTDESYCVDNQGIPVASGGTNGVKAVFAIDLDGDTHIDVLSASANDDTIAWYENNGLVPPSFTQHVITTNADGASSVAAGDLDGDGDIDVVSASGNDDKIAWYENDGGEMPRFIERVITTDARNAAAVYLADVDADGDLDVLAASLDDDTVAWYESDYAQQVAALPEPEEAPNPIPAFTNVTLSISADGAASVFAAELATVFDPQNEEFPEILEVLSASRLDDTIAWYEREILVNPDDETDKAVLWIRRVIDSNVNGATSVFAAELDGNPGIDILSAAGGDGKIAWYRNDGADPPSFTKLTISTEAAGASAVFAADLDDDGDADVLSASRFDDTIAWYENLGGGDFGLSTQNRKLISTDAPGAAAVYVSDLDHDNDLDVVAVSSVAGAVASDDKIAWHENYTINDQGPPDPEDLFPDEHLISGGAVAPETLLVADVGDGEDLDVLIASSVDDTILWYESDGMDPPAFTQRLLSEDAPGVTDLFWADLDPDIDELPDLVAALAGEDSIAWYKNLGDGNFGDRMNIALFSADGASAVFVADLDDDGDPDVLSASADDDTIAWYENDGSGDFGDPIDNQRIITDSADGASAVVAADMDDDGDLDVLAASANDNSIRWFESDLNDAPGKGSALPGFTSHLVSSVESGAQDVLAAYVDGDEKLDIVSAAAGSNTIVWFAQGFDTVPPQLSSLEPGETAICVATFEVGPADTTITNTVTVTATDAELVSVSDTHTLMQTLDPFSSSSVDIVKSSDPTALPALDETITYSYTVTNTGGVTLTDLSVTDPHEGLSAIDCEGESVEPQIASLGPGSSVECVASYTVTASDVTAASIENTATVTATATGDVSLSDTGTLTLTPEAFSSIRVVKSSDATGDTVEGDTITYTYAVTNTGGAALNDLGVVDPHVGSSSIHCGEIAFQRRSITGSAFRVRTLVARDIDDDGDMDIAAASSGDDSITWFENDYAQQLAADPPPEEDPIPAFTERPVSTTSESARVVAVADLDDDGALDIVSGFLFEVAWHPGDVEEQCTDFDATGDDEIDGDELGLLGGAFGQDCGTAGPDPWWLPIDYTGDCRVDGEDLAILTARGVWGTVTVPPDPDDPDARPLCAYTCP